MDLIIRDLTKVYKNGVCALDGINLSIKPGMFGLLGPNGAGKSTFMRTIATLQDADSGSVTFGDIDVQQEPQRIRNLLGYLPQDFGVYPGVSGEKLLSYLALLKGMTDHRQRRNAVAHLLEQVNLYDDRKKSVSQYSGGMRQRFGIAQALIGDPKLIIVDEPTAGLDPLERGRFNALLNDISSDRLVILSTHIVSDVWDLCPQMAIMSKGRLAAYGAPQELVSALEGEIWEGNLVTSEPMEGQVLSTRLKHGITLQRVRNTKQPGPDFTKSQADLEDVYFNALAEA